jgi:hypothetical protein
MFDYNQVGTAQVVLRAGERCRRGSSSLGLLGTSRPGPTALKFSAVVSVRS